MTVGVDYAFGPHPSPAALKAAGVQFVMRYISSYPPNDSNGKNLLAGEFNALMEAGLAVGVVIEEGSGYMLGGHDAGAAAARHADAVVRSLGMPGVPVYIACDFDAAPGQQDAIDACLDGMASVIGHGRVGIYGGYYPVKRALDAGKAAYAWQTIAWSGGQWDPRANLRQGLQVMIGGASCDHDTAITADYGQWPRPHSPAPRPSPVPAPAPEPAPQPAPSPEATVVELDTSVASHPLLIPFGTSSMDLLSVNTEADPCVVEVTFLHQGADAKQYSLSWGTADTVGSGIEVPEGIKKAKLDVVSGSGLPVAVRYNQ